MTDEKPYFRMTDAELAQSGCEWAARVDDACGFPSAYFAAEQVAMICATANRRGLGFINPRPIRVGDPA